MHQAVHLPGNDAFPHAQLVGGGPELKQATWIEGKEVKKVSFTPLGS